MTNQRKNRGTGTQPVPVAPAKDPFAIYSELKSKFVKTSWYHDFIKALDHLMVQAGLSETIPAPPSKEGAIIVLVGESGAGKTTVVDKVFKQYPIFADYDDPDKIGTLLSISAPSPCTPLQLGRRLLESLGFPLATDMREHIVWEKVRHRLRKMRIRVLHIDEMLHLTQLANVKEIQKFLNTIKSLAQQRDWPVSIILAGTPELIDVIEKDVQVARRSRFVLFPSLQIPEDNAIIASIIKRYCAGAHLEIDEATLTPLTPRLTHAARAQFGTAIEILNEAIYLALIRLKAGRPNSVGVDGPPARLPMSDFAAAYAARTGCTAIANPFIADDWQHIDTTKVLNRGAATRPAPVPDTKTKKEKRKW